MALRQRAQKAKQEAEAQAVRPGVGIASAEAIHDEFHQAVPLSPTAAAMPHGVCAAKRLRLFAKQRRINSIATFSATITPLISQKRVEAELRANAAADAVTAAAAAAAAAEEKLLELEVGTHPHWFLASYSNCCIAARRPLLPACMHAYTARFHAAAASDHTILRPTPHQAKLKAEVAQRAAAEGRAAEARQAAKVKAVRARGGRPSGAVWAWIWEMVH